MLITHSAKFEGSRPTEFPLRSRSVLRPNADREYCSICTKRSNPHHRGRCVAIHKGKSHIVCGGCSKLYHDPVRQIEHFGFRFRFVERSEVNSRIPTGIEASEIATLPRTKEIYKLLLLLKERLEIQQKEVNWNVDEQTKRILQLPSKIAGVVAQTWEVQGDDAEIDNSTAITRIRDMLDEIDTSLIEKALRKKIRKRLP